MNHTSWRRRDLPFAVVGLMLWFGISAHCFAQAQGGRRGQPPTAPQFTGRAATPTEVDLTGYWVSLVTEDWRWRMVTPAKGDFASIPLTPAGRTAGNAWDPAKDEAAGEQCRAYGAGGIMRLPGNLHISWQ